MIRQYLLRLILVISVILIASILGFSFARLYGLLPRTEINLRGELNLTGGGRKVTYPYLGPEEMKPSNVTPCLNWIKINNIITTSKDPLSEDSRYPAFEGKPKHEFRQGEAIWIYFEFSYFLSFEDRIEEIIMIERISASFNDSIRCENIYTRVDGDLILIAKIVSNLTIVDQHGNVRMRTGLSNELMCYTSGGLYSSTGEGRERFIFAGKVPFSLEPGEYRVLATVVDLLTGKKDEKIVNITVLKGEYKEIRFFPISKSPDVLLLKEDELPGLWEYVYYYNFSLWEPHYEQQIWMTTKGFVRKDGVTRTITIEIMLFETPEGARSYFDELLRGFNESYPQDLSERISSVPGVESFIYIDYETYVHNKTVTRLRTISIYSLVKNVVITVKGGGYLEGVLAPSPLMEEVLDIAEMQEMKVIGRNP